MTSNLNESINGSYLVDPDEQYMIEVGTIINNVCIPCISIIGLIGNSLSLIVFSARSMKKSASSVFLAALAFADNMFLVSLLLSWIDSQYYNMLRFDTACAVVISMTYVSSFLSVWLIVCFTTERFIAISFPLNSLVFCSMVREKLIVVCFSFIGVVLYLFPFWTVEVRHTGNRVRCSPRRSSLPFMHVTAWIDTIVTMIVPFVLIIVMNVKVACKAAAFHNKRQMSRKCPAFTHRSLRYKPQMRVTRTLMLVSTTFLLLNLPSHVLRLRNLIVVNSNPGAKMTLSYFVVQQVALTLYYSTFSCNFILYTMFGRHFQKSLKAILFCRSTVRRKSVTMMRSLSSPKSGNKSASL